MSKGELIFNGPLKGAINQLGRTKIFIHFESPGDANFLAKSLREMDYEVKIEGPLLSFYPEHDLDISNLTRGKISDTWKVDASLEEVYLKLVTDDEVDA